ncbi:hypothetical protein B0H13DRAFT_2520063 [Mycena leptocephala]|nr:hypothetical protein B0H13DRAFT_2520063 [Mycena leptocephala]
MSDADSPMLAANTSDHSNMQLVRVREDEQQPVPSKRKVVGGSLIDEAKSQAAYYKDRLQAQKEKERIDKTYNQQLRSDLNTMQLEIGKMNMHLETHTHNQCRWADQLTQEQHEKERLANNNQTLLEQLKAMHKQKEKQTATVEKLADDAMAQQRQFYTELKSVAAEKERLAKKAQELERSMIEKANEAAAVRAKVANQASGSTPRTHRGKIMSNVELRNISSRIPVLQFTPIAIPSTDPPSEDDSEDATPTIPGLNLHADRYARLAQEILKLAPGATLGVTSPKKRRASSKCGVENTEQFVFKPTASEEEVQACKQGYLEVQPDDYRFYFGPGYLQARWNHVVLRKIVDAAMIEGRHLTPVPREWLLEQLTGQMKRAREAWARPQARGNETAAEGIARANQYREERAEATCGDLAKSQKFANREKIIEFIITLKTGTNTPDVPAWKRILEMLHHLGNDGMSSEEEFEEIRSGKKWSGYKTSGRVALDGGQHETEAVQGSDWSPGPKVLPRERSDEMSLSAAPKGLPECLYDAGWIARESKKSPVFYADLAVSKEVFYLLTASTDMVEYSSTFHVGDLSPSSSSCILVRLQEHSRRGIRQTWSNSTGIGKVWTRWFVVKLRVTKILRGWWQPRRTMPSANPLIDDSTQMGKVCAWMSSKHRSIAATLATCFKFLHIASIHPHAPNYSVTLKIPPTITSARTCPTCTNLMEAIAASPKSGAAPVAAGARGEGHADGDAVGACEGKKAEISEKLGTIGLAACVASTARPTLLPAIRPTNSVHRTTPALRYHPRTHKSMSQRVRGTPFAKCERKGQKSAERRMGEALGLGLRKAQSTPGKEKTSNAAQTLYEKSVLEHLHGPGEYIDLTGTTYMLLADSLSLPALLARIHTYVAAQHVECKEAGIWGSTHTGSTRRGRPRPATRSSWWGRRLRRAWRRLRASHAPYEAQKPTSGALGSRVVKKAGKEEVISFNFLRASVKKKVGEENRMEEEDTTQTQTTETQRTAERRSGRGARLRGAQRVQGWSMGSDLSRNDVRYSRGAAGTRDVKEEGRRTETPAVGLSGAQRARGRGAGRRGSHSERAFEIREVRQAGGMVEVRAGGDFIPNTCVRALWGAGDRRAGAALHPERWRSGFERRRAQKARGWLMTEAKTDVIQNAGVRDSKGAAGGGGLRREGKAFRMPAVRFPRAGGALILNARVRALRHAAGVGDGRGVGRRPQTPVVGLSGAQMVWGWSIDGEMTDVIWAPRSGFERRSGRADIEGAGGWS